MTAALSSPDASPPPAEALTARQWCDLLGVRPQSFRARCEPTATREGRLQLFAFADLPADYRARLGRLRAERFAESFTALLRQRHEAEALGWQPPKPYLQYKPSVRVRAERKHAAMKVWFAALANGATRQTAAPLVAAEHERLGGKRVCAHQVFRWAKVLAARGGEHAPLAAYCDDKDLPKPGRRLQVPDDFLAAVRSKAMEPGVGEWAAAVRAFHLDWSAGAEVPGLGRHRTPGEPFPYTAAQLRKFRPGQAALVMATRGKFAAKAAKLLPAPPISRRKARLRERIVFDDKRLDIISLDDSTGRPCTLTSCWAMDEGTSQILGYLLRPDGGLRAADVEGLTAFVLRVCGFAGRRAGYATTLKFERGAVAISADREALLCGMFPGELLVSRATMIGGNSPGGFVEKASGNFHGKGRLESFFHTLDHLLKHAPGQRGQSYRQTPAMLGDTTATPEMLAHPNYRAKGSQIEEALAAAQVGIAEHARQTGAENIVAFHACESTGIRPALLFVSEVHAVIRAAIEHYNGQRGHRREGFAQIIAKGADGIARPTVESANDKAARLQAALEAEGRGLSIISAGDAAVLLHKVKRVTVRPGGARVRIGGEQRTYWHEDSLAVAAAQQSSLREKEYVALFNPDDPRELYLLHNPPGHVPATAMELPPGEAPHFFESLPLYTAPDASDEKALAERAARVARNHGRVILEVNRAALPFTAAQTARRERNLAVAEPLREAVTVLREEAARIELPTTPIGAAFTASEHENAARANYLQSLQRAAQQQAEDFDER